MKALEILGADLTPEHVAEISRKMALGTALGVLVGSIGGLALWSAHRVTGALLGGLLIGPTAGGLVSFWFVSKSFPKTPEVK